MRWPGPCGYPLVNESTRSEGCSRRTRSVRHSRLPTCRHYRLDRGGLSPRARRLRSNRLGLRPSRPDEGVASHESVGHRGRATLDRRTDLTPCPLQWVGETSANGCGQRSIGNLRRQAEWVTGRINQHEVAVGCRLRLRSNGTERSCPLLSEVKIIDSQVKVHLFGHQALRPRRSRVGLDPSGGQPHSINLHGGKILIRKCNLASEQVSPEGAELARVGTIQRYGSQTYVRHTHKLRETAEQRQPNYSGSYRASRTTWIEHLETLGSMCA